MVSLRIAFTAEDRASTLRTAPLATHVDRISPKIGLLRSPMARFAEVTPKPGPSRRSPRQACAMGRAPLVTLLLPFAFYKPCISFATPRDTWWGRHHHFWRVVPHDENLLPKHWPSGRERTCRGGNGLWLGRLQLGRRGNGRLWWPDGRHNVDDGIIWQVDQQAQQHSTDNVKQLVVKRRDHRQQLDQRVVDQRGEQQQLE